MRFRHRFRRGYLFGYGADQEEDMVVAITGEKPKVVGKATLKGYELRIQKLDEVTTEGGNPRELLRKVWGDSFKSYAIVPKQDAQVVGTVFKLTNRARNKIDKWELVQMGWYEKVFVSVEMQDTGQKLRVETQVLHSSRQAKEVAKKGHRPWLLAKRRFLERARKSR